MTVKDALQEATNTLYYAEVGTPYLDACVLLAHALETSKEHLFSSFYTEVAPEAYACFREYVNRRCLGIPVSYIRHKKEFYGLEFYVDERVLVPRPDSETLVETVGVILRKHEGLKKIHDVCTGSGCIAITLQHLFPEMEVTASDISAGAGEVFLHNCRKLLHKELPFYQTDLLSGLDGGFDIIVSNPPYLTDAEASDLKNSGWPEPELALRAGENGCFYLMELIKTAPRCLGSGGYLVLEASPPQMKILTDFMHKLNYINITVEQDLAGRKRVLYASV